MNPSILIIDGAPPELRKYRIWTHTFFMIKNVLTNEGEWVVGESRIEQLGSVFKKRLEWDRELCKPQCAVA